MPITGSTVAVDGLVARASPGSRRGELGSYLVNPAEHSASAALLGDCMSLVEECRGPLRIAFLARELGQGDEACSHTGREPDLTPQPHRFLESLTRRREVPGGEVSESQMAHRVGLRQFVVDLHGQLERALEVWEGSRAVVVHNLVEDPYPKQSFGFAALVAQAPVEFHSPLEEGQLVRVLLPLDKEPCVHDASARECEVGLHLIQLAVGGSQGVDVTAEDRALVQLLRAVNPAVPAHERNPFQAHQPHLGARPISIRDTQSLIILVSR